MFGGSQITLLHVRGIRISVDWSWFIVLFLVIIWLSDFYTTILGDPSSNLVPYSLAVASAAGFFGSILLHELGHAIVAMRNGIGISGIQLWIFGGVARLERDSNNPGEEFKVAIAGPAVTLAIAVVAAAIGVIAAGPADFKEAMLVRGSADTSGLLAMVAWLATINILIFAFNMLPAFPMDGGRIARAIAWKKTGNRASATRFAARLGQVFAYIFMGIGFLLAANGDLFSGAWLIVIGFVINGSARATAAQTTISSRIEGIRVSDVMDSEPVSMPSDISIEKALDEYFLRYRWQWFPVVDAAQRFRGLMIRDRADQVPEMSRPIERVEQHIEEDPGSLHVSEDTPLEELLGNQSLRRFGALMAVDGNGRLRGVITADQVGRALRDATMTEGASPIG